MTQTFESLISRTLNLRENQVTRTIGLLNDGATIPFISRYRKEATGGLDEVILARIGEEYEKFKDLQKRKETILSTIDEQGKLTPELKQRIKNTFISSELEDIYLPYKPKRKTRASQAKEAGLEPLAEYLIKQLNGDIYLEAEKYINDKITTADEALKGASDIIAEQISENELSRNKIRNVFRRKAIITSTLVKGKEEEGSKYRDYFEWNEPWQRCSSHRYLAMRRGETEGFLKLTVTPDDDQCIEALKNQYVKGRNDASELIADTVTDAYKRLLKSSIENELKAEMKEKADEEAIKVFAENTRQLLLASPLGEKRTMGIDPGFRTGCKIVCLDEQGNLLHYEAIYPHPPQADLKGAINKMYQLIKGYKVEAIAIGNGTASRETEQFVKSLKLDKSIQVFIVSENGASIYSASKIAREEFPDKDVTVRGAVSIARRLMDPLAELVKIDPKSIGVGQYQHDVDQNKLKRSLDLVVESCVNSVGVNVNTASKYLLNYVSGLGPVLAQNIIDYRMENGPFKSRKEFMKVPRLGAKAFEQCAAFLRIPGAKNPLDNSAVHPESYSVVEKIAKDLQTSVDDLIKNQELRKQIHPEKYVSGEIGLPTITDIIKELDKPGRDPRKPITVFSFDPNIRTIDDLREGMILPGIINNITNFGCFVDIGIKENGLVHISQLTDRYISDPNEVVRLHQHVDVKILSIDKERKRIQLSLLTGK